VIAAGRHTKTAPLVRTALSIPGTALSLFCGASRVSLGAFPLFVVRSLKVGRRSRPNGALVGSPYAARRSSGNVLPSGNEPHAEFLTGRLWICAVYNLKSWNR